MMYLKIIDDRIAAIYCGKKPIGTVDVGDDFQGRVGQHIGEFDDRWEMYPLSKRCADEYVEAPRGYKLQGEDWVEMSQEEKYIFGIETLPDGLVIDSGKVREITQKEKISAGLVTQNDADEENRRVELARLLSDLASTDWYTARLAETGRAIPDEILAKRQSARERISDLKRYEPQ